MASSDIYGENAALLAECGVVEYSNATSFVTVQLTHLPTGTTARAVGRGHIGTKCEALAKLASRLSVQAENMCADCGCWTGGADCPHCVPGATHPRGRC